MLTFIKLGGSLITDKSSPYTANRPVIKQLGIEIHKYLMSNAGEQILIGHGSGSFGHEAGKKFNTRSGVHNAQQWVGFQEVWWAAHQLNQIVCELFVEIGLPIISLPASASLYSKDHSIVRWNTKPIESSLDQRLIPVIFGDVIFDKIKGGVIYSTEELFSGLFDYIKPDRILIAGKETGVFSDFPNNKSLIKKITPKTFYSGLINLEKSAEKDVTGGMAAKVDEMIGLVEKHRNIQIQIFSSLEANNLYKSLSGEEVGTRISYN